MHLPLEQLQTLKFLNSGQSIYHLRVFVLVLEFLHHVKKKLLFRFSRHSLLRKKKVGSAYLIDQAVILVDIYSHSIFLFKNPKVNVKRSERNWKILKCNIQFTFPVKDRIWGHLSILFWNGSVPCKTASCSLEFSVRLLVFWG